MKNPFVLFISFLVASSSWAALEVDLIYTGNFTDSHTGTVQFAGSSDSGTPTLVDTARVDWVEPAGIFINDSTISYSANASTILTSSSSVFESTDGIVFRYDSVRGLLELEVNLQTDSVTTLTGLDVTLAPDTDDSVFWEKIAPRVGTSTTLQPDFFGSGFGNVDVNFVPEPQTAAFALFILTATALIGWRKKR